jgi:endonuclease/exonuclease/phosphatase family metal-dependent hydrolase
LPRILTYNVRHCLGIDGRLCFERIADVIASCEPDIVALQELDAHRARSGGVDQAWAIADELRMEAHFFPAIREKDEAYGDAILTAHPCTLVKAGLLPTLRWRPFMEPRGALWVTVQVGGAEIQVFNTHLGLLEALRLRQVGGLLGPDWIAHSDCREPVILAGDFNAIPGSRTYKRLAARLRDAETWRGTPRRQPTYPSRAPLLRLDHVFVSRSIEVLKAQVVRTPLARIASDHLPLLVDFRVIAPEQPGRESRDALLAEHR